MANEPVILNVYDMVRGPQSPSAATLLLYPPSVCLLGDVGTTETPVSPGWKEPGEMLVLLLQLVSMIPHWCVNPLTMSNMSFMNLVSLITL